MGAARKYATCASANTKGLIVTNAAQPHQRTLGQAVSDVRFAVHYAARNERWWRRVDTLLSLTGAIAGSAAFGSLFAADAAWGPWASGVVAVASCVALVTKPMDKAIEFRDYKRKFAELDAVAWSMSLPDLDARLRTLRQEPLSGFDSLEPTAWNDMVMADGHTDRVRKLTLMQWLMACMA